MRNFYIVVPALSLLNMGVSGATIANTLTARSDARAESNGLYKGPISHHRNRQIHTADFSSGTDADASAEVQTPDRPAAPAPASESETPSRDPDGITSSVPVDPLVARALSSHIFREVQPAMTFKRRINGAPHEMARHVRRELFSDILEPFFLEEESATSAAEKTTEDESGRALAATKSLASTGNANTMATNKSILSDLKTGSFSPSNLFNKGVSTKTPTHSALGELVLRDHSSTEPYQRYEEYDNDKNFGERTSSDIEPLAFSRGMHRVRQVGLTSESNMDDVPFADFTLGSRSDDSTHAPRKLGYESMLEELPSFEGDIQKRPAISARARADLPVAVSDDVGNSIASLPVVGGVADRRAPGDDARGLMKVAKFKSLPAVNANFRRAHASRMIRRKTRRQDDVEAADAEGAPGVAGDDAAVSTDDAGEGAGSLNEVD